MTAPPAKQREAESNRQAIRDTLADADRDLAKPTIAERAGCSSTTVLRHVREMDDVIETRRIRNTPLYELDDEDDESPLGTTTIENDYIDNAE